MTEEYEPIPCDRYAELEQAVVRRQRLRVAWRDPAGQLRVEVLRPRDLVTRRPAEWLIVLDAEDERFELRLDWIFRFEVLP